MNSYSSSSTTGRLTAKQADAQGRRNRMTQRRHELTNTIRKQKKSQYLSRKRNFSTTTTTIAQSHLSTETISNVANLIQAYLQSPTATVSHLATALRNSNVPNANNDNPLVFIGQDDATSAISLMQRLRQTLQSSPQQEEQQLMALQVLVHLTAIYYAPSSDDDYYGQAPATWCTCLLMDPELLPILVSRVPYLEPAIVILGNLAGDNSQQVRQRLRESGMVEALVQVIRQQAQAQEPVLVGLQSSAATWALTNLIRNDGSTIWARTYCSDDLLSPPLLERLLLSQAGGGGGGVATQASWMIASLTNREEEVVNYLCSSPNASFCASLIQALDNSISCPRGGDNDDQRLPLIQALGHIASYEAHVPTLLALNLAPLVARILQQGNELLRGGPILQQTAWLAGCLLCDAGLAQHPSTTVAAPMLIPVLMRLLSSSQQQQLKMDEQREVASALWNALAPPPSHPQNGPIDGSGSGSNNLFLPPMEELYPTISALVDLSSRNDADATLAAVNVLNILLRRIPTLRTVFEEANGREALEGVCDSSHEEAAEVAANLLDDFFDNEEEEEQDYGPLPAFGGTQLFGDFGQGVTSAGAPPPPPSRGAGRGRGAVLPSWMQS
jgi:hypothetical protein